MNFFELEMVIRPGNLLLGVWTLYMTVHIALALANRPNIVIFMADDLGFDDVSFRGSNEFLTPNIDALAYSGVILNRYYVSAMCTPSRAALMTGKYPINTGMQHYVISNDEPWGLPLNEKTFAEIFKEAGYFTSLIGKWHLGFAEKAYTPLNRGFDHHYGYLGAYVDYYNQTTFSPQKPYARGHDFRYNLNITRENQGTYVTDSLTEEAVKLITQHNTEKPLLMILSQLAPHTGNVDSPLQAPEEEIKKFSYISNAFRKVYAAMVSKLDESVGKVVNSLNTKGILNNTILLFFSDNGAPYLGLHANNGSNYPLRGQKNSPWEGAIRSSAAIWSTLLRKHGSVWDQTMHVTDWLPTLASAAGITIDSSIKLDGLNLWSNLTAGAAPAPRKVLHNIDDLFKYVSYNSDVWKYVNGTTDSGKYDGWLRNRDYVHIDPRSNHYVDTIKQSVVWKHLAQSAQSQISSIDIERLRKKAGFTCAGDKKSTPCRPLEDECIFNIIDDPCERDNLIYQMRNSEVLKTIRAEVNEFRRNAKTPVNLPTDPNCDPKYYNFEWTWWKDVK